MSSSASDFTLHTHAAELKYRGRDDVLLIACPPNTQWAAVFTTNTLHAAPVILGKAALESGQPLRALIINAGNANAFTGDEGLAHARTTCAAAAEALGVPAESVLPVSTGVIGEQLDPEAMRSAAIAVAAADPVDLSTAAQAIMTTDAYPKTAQRYYRHAGQVCRMQGMAKGAGMIAPNMATMLGFVLMHAPVEIDQATLQRELRHACARSFNSISVDSDTSTNDSVFLLCSPGGAPASEAVSESIDSAATIDADWPTALRALTRDLAWQIVGDGEGATKRIDVTVSGASCDADAKAIARSIAESPLVKTAIAGEDANWGRIVMAIGKSGVSPIDSTQVQIAIGGIALVANGAPLADFDESAVTAHLGGDVVAIDVEIGNGAGVWQFFGCDFNETYIRINASYRS